LSDLVVRALAYHQSVRVYAVSTKDILNIIGDKMSYYPSALDAMGRILSMGAMMGAMLKKEETVTIKVEGDGPIGKIIVDADAHGHMRGYASNPHCHFEYIDNRLNVKQTIGSTGFISVIKDLKLKELFIGSTPIINGEMAEDFAYYFNVSEQVPSAVGLGVLVDENSRALASGGFIIQLLPNASEEVIENLEKKLAIIPSVSEMLSSGFTPQDIIYNICEDVEILDTTPIGFQCGCSKERFARGILSLGKDEIEQMIEEDKTQETICHFCGEKYYFTKDDLIELLNIVKGEK
jgi:hsp33 protein